MKYNFINKFQREPVTAATLIAGASSAVGAGANAYAQGKMNNKTREYNKWAMKQQREWALSDWERQNLYNSPAQQMQRLREAGLNPHLIYAGGQPTNAATAVDSTNINSWNPSTPNIGAMLTDPVNSYLETRKFTAQQKLLDAQTFKALTEAQTKEFDLDQKKLLAETQASLLREILTGKKIENTLNADENIRRNLMTSSNLSEAAGRMAKNLTDIQLNEMMERKGNEEIKNITQMRKKVQAEINNLNKDGIIKDFEISLNKAGFTKSDPVYFRLGKVVLEGLLGIDVSEQIKSLSEELNKLGDKGKKIKESLQKVIKSRPESFGSGWLY